uniref:Uncharacterized protein n=1 Tax=Panagrolaimus davidi TaxID=227884 RepID=A0A914PQQ5_9BILA
MGNAMAFNSIESCNSSVNGSIGAVNLVQKNDDYCDMSTSLETAKLQCCCIHEPQYCSPQSLTYTSGDDNKLYTLFYCLSGKANTSEYDVVQQSHITLQEYIMNNVNFFCTITISMQKETENVESIANAIVEYGAKNICESETIITLGSSESFCTFGPYFPKEIEIKKCCKDGHFCNKKFTPKKIKETFKCYYKFKYAAFLTTDDDPKCERFYDIWFKKDAFSKIIFHYNAKFPDGEKK